MPGGLLAKGLPAPEGWERGGLLIPFNGCGAPTLRDKCVPDVDDLTRGDTSEFPAIPIEQGAICSTTGPDSQQDQAFARFNATAEWALGRQLQTDAINSGAPKLDDAVSMGTVADANFVAAVSCLEQAAADTGYGARFVLHAPLRAAAYLADANLIDGNGNSPTGAPWVFSAGYQSHPTTPDTLVRLYVTGTVWASLATPWAVEGTAYRVNDQWAQARGVGVAAFDPCMLSAIDVTVPACP
jgi:hypothetical protein